METSWFGLTEERFPNLEELIWVHGFGFDVHTKRLPNLRKMEAYQCPGNLYDFTRELYPALEEIILYRGEISGMNFLDKPEMKRLQLLGVKFRENNKSIWDRIN